MQYFRVASDALRALDDSRIPEPEIIDRLRRLETSLTSHLRDPLLQEEHFQLRGSDASGGSSWILVYDWQTGQRLQWMQFSGSPKAAAHRYGDWERRFREHEVVLIGSDSEKTVEWTHAHYFGRSQDDIDPTAS